MKNGELNAAERRQKWNKLKAEYGPKLEERVAAIRALPWVITRIEARIVVLASLEYNVAATAQALGIDEQTVKNHRTDVRNKVGIPKEELAFDLIYMRLIPASEKM